MNYAFCILFGLFLICLNNIILIVCIDQEKKETGYRYGFTCALFAISFISICYIADGIYVQIQSFTSN